MQSISGFPDVTGACNKISSSYSFCGVVSKVKEKLLKIIFKLLN